MSKDYGKRARQWPAELHLRLQRQLATSRVELWEAEVAAGRRPLTPALAEAMATDRALVERLLAELREVQGPGPEKQPGAVVGV